MAAPVFSLACAAYGAGARQRPHSHEELQITVVLVGGVEEHVGAAVERATALSVVVKDPGVVHDDVFGRSGALTARLSLPATTFTDLVEHPRRAGAWRWSHDARVALPFLRLVRRGVEGEQHFPGDDDDVLDFLAAISARLAAPHHPDAPRWLADAVQGVQEDWRPGLTVRDVARLAGVHPVYFARCVRRWYGVAAAELLRQSRLRHAARTVADGDQTISTVAHATGFADEAHLSREFSKSTGLPPARYRRLARAFGRGFTDSSGSRGAPAILRA